MYIFINYRRAAGRIPFLSDCKRLERTCVPKGTTLSCRKQGRYVRELFRFSPHIPSLSLSCTAHRWALVSCTLHGQSCRARSKCRSLHVLVQVASPFWLQHWYHPSRGCLARYDLLESPRQWRCLPLQHPLQSL